jgi:DNA-directed RNA polymerase subunit E'/Rpb7
LDGVVSQTNAHGFFAHVGPVRVFVPEDHMPGDYNFDNETSVWISADETVAIKEGTAVRFRVLQVKPLDGFCLASIRDDFLGIVKHTSVKVE